MSKENIIKLFEEIKRNEFVNDSKFKERADDNINKAHEIREYITSGYLDKTIEDRRLQVEILDFLESHNI